MGTLVGHVAPGFAFLALGLWHLFNHIKLFCLQPKSYTSSPWFPTSKLRHLELYLIMLGSSISIAMELVIGPRKHQPFDSDGSIPANHLHNFEHSSISVTFFVYAAFALVFDKTGTRASYGLTNFVGAVAFAQQLFLFHLHSSDHMGIEGHYHLLLQFVIFVSLVTTLLGMAMPESFLASFVRSSSIAFQGVWLIAMGYMLWTPSLIPKGCFLHLEDGHRVVRCSSHDALDRAKSLVNIEFSWFLVGITLFVVSLYLFLDRVYGENVQYSTLTARDQTEQGIEPPNISKPRWVNWLEIVTLKGEKNLEKINGVHTDHIR
ncbi:PREDICTED: transmembrane protein 45B-like [Tarenaya hassleriana]|uniref:transmembrane protein 45B-like n=1 Tax=Tarenaya hassleriana TaxID=28532 RepID=UPI00053C0A76|nr:PREDICTED: transmembrane protein 45B-like [Tarenaya hassleriana]